MRSRRARTMDKQEARLRLAQCEERRQRVLRGDGMIGILPAAEIEQMVTMYRALGEAGVADAWLGLGRYHTDQSGLHWSMEDAADCACRAIVQNQRHDAMAQRVQPLGGAGERLHRIFWPSPVFFIALPHLIKDLF